MTRDRFESILGILHLPDPHQDYAGNRLGKIANFVAQLNKSFQAAWQLGRNLFIDKTLIPCKGRTFLKQYIETKPFKWDIELWVLACSCTGYVWQLSVYAGKQREVTEHGL